MWVQATVELEKAPDKLTGRHFIPSGQQFHIKQMKTERKLWGSIYLFILDNYSDS